MFVITKQWAVLSTKSCPRILIFIIDNITLTAARVLPKSTGFIWWVINNNFDFLTSSSTQPISFALDPISAKVELDPRPTLG